MSNYALLRRPTAFVEADDPRLNNPVVMTVDDEETAPVRAVRPIQIPLSPERAANLRLVTNTTEPAVDVPPMSAERAEQVKLLRRPNQTSENVINSGNLFAIRPSFAVKDLSLSNGENIAQPAQIMPVRPIPQTDSAGSNSLDVNSPEVQAMLNPKSRRDLLIEKYLAAKDEKIVDRDKNPFLNILKAMGIRALQNFNQTQGAPMRLRDRLLSAAGAGMAGGVEGGIRGTVDEEFMKNRRLAEMQNDIGIATELEKQGQELEQGAYNNVILAQRPSIAAAQMKNLEEDNLRARDELKRKQEKDEYEKEQDKAELLDKRAKTLAGMFNRVTTFDPDAPQNKGLIKAMEEVGLPVFKKDATKDVKYIQDERTGAWFISSTDKTTGKTETNAVLKDGQPLVTTPRIIIQGETSRDIANINQQGATNRTQITQQGATTRNQYNQQQQNERLDKTLKNSNTQQKERLVQQSLDRWKEQYIKSHFGEAPSQAEIDQARQALQQTIFPEQ